MARTKKKPKEPDLSRKGGTKVALALTNPDPIAALDHEAFTFAMHRAMGKSQVAALRKAKPDWDESAILANAHIWNRRPDIVRAMQTMMEKFAEAREETVIASVHEVLAFATRAIREPLSVLDDDDPLIVEHRTTNNANGSSETFKKVDPLGAAKLLLEHHGKRPGGSQKIGDMTKGEFIGLLRKPGLPQASAEDGKIIDLTEDDCELLDDEEGRS